VTEPTATEQDAPTETPTSSYFSELVVSQAEAGDQRRFRPPLRQQLTDAGVSQLLLVSLHTDVAQAREDEFWHDLSNDSDAEDGEFAFASVDDAFESLATF